MQITKELKKRERRISNVVFARNITEEKIRFFTQAVNVEKPSKIVKVTTQQKLHCTLLL